MEIIRGVIPCAKKVVIYGPEGIGKSTFASKFPDPVFIDTEGSTNSMDVAEMKIRKGLFTENNVEKQRKKKYSKNKSIV